MLNMLEILSGGGEITEGLDLGVPGYESIQKIAGTKVSWSGAAWVIVDKDNMDQYNI
jgi:simple sugar transport system substrate-binding protein